MGTALADGGDGEQLGLQSRSTFPCMPIMTFYISLLVGVHEESLIFYLPFLLVGGN